MAHSTAEVNTISYLGRCARAYAQAGYAVFPITPGQKKPPLTEHGFKDATRDLDQIARWWETWPKANIGVVPGRSGHVVLDVDIKSGGNGHETLGSLEIDHTSVLPPALTVHTPSGGQHLWYKLPDGTEPPGNQQAGPHVDVRSGSGYVLVPPSVVDGKSYRLDTSGDGPRSFTKAAPVLPATWASMLAGGASAASKLENEAPETLDHPSDIRRAILHAQRAEPATAGNRNTSAFKLACELRDYGLSAAKVHAIMAEHWNQRCDPPLDDAPEAEHTDALAQPVASAYRNARHQEPGIQSIQNSKLLDIDTGVEPANDDDAVPDLGDENRFDDGFLPETEIDALKPPEWLIKDTLPKASLSVMYGPPGSHKSFLALDMASHLARGWGWAGYRVTRPARVLYVAGEGTSGLQKRSQAWRQHHGAEPTDGLTFFKSMPRIADDNDWSNFCNALERKAGQQGFDLVVFDTLARLAVGLNENDNGDIGRVVGKLEALQSRLGCAVMVVHHTGKDEAKGMRGGSALLGAADTAFAVKKVSATTSSLEVTKQKDAEAWRGHIGFSATEYEVGRDDENDPITSLAFTAGHRSTVSEADRRDQRREARDQNARDSARVTLVPEVENILNANGELTNSQLVRFIIEERIADGTETENNDAVRRRIRQNIRDCLDAEKGKGPLTRMVASWTRARGPNTWKIQGCEGP